MRIARTIFFWLHLVSGISAGLVILVMSLTGFLLAFERQIKASSDLYPAQTEHLSPTSPVNLEAILSTVQGYDRVSPSNLIIRNRPGAAVEVRFGRDRTLYVDPSTGQVIGQPSMRVGTFLACVERVHRSMGLGMQSAFGRGITGAANLAFLFMIVSGFYLWLPRVYSKTSLRNRCWFRKRLHGRARDWHWHSVIGIWTAVPSSSLSSRG